MTRYQITTLDEDGEKRNLVIRVKGQKAVGFTMTDEGDIRVELADGSFKNVTPQHSTPPMETNSHDEDVKEDVKEEEGDQRVPTQQQEQRSKEKKKTKKKKDKKSERKHQDGEVPTIRFVGSMFNPEFFSQFESLFSRFNISFQADENASENSFPHTSGARTTHTEDEETPKSTESKTKHKKKKDKKSKPKHKHEHSSRSSAEVVKEVWESHNAEWEMFQAECNSNYNSNSNSDKRLCIDDIPWPPSVHNIIRGQLSLFTASSADEKEVRKAFREAVLRWHPDKFVQQFGELLHPEHRDAVLQRVKEIAQAINDEWSALSSSSSNSRS